MTLTPRIFYGRFLSVVLLACAVLAPKVQGFTQPELPVWRALEFERKAFLATAYSYVEVQKDSCDAQRWKMTANNAIYNALMRNDELKELTLTPDEARLVQRRRYSGGSNKRFKFYDYLPQHIARERREAGSVENASPENWPLSDRSRIKYPRLPEDAVITDAYALLLLATRFYDNDDKSLEVVVQTDFNFYRVRMTHGTRGELEVKYQIDGQRSVSGKRRTQSVILQVDPLGELTEESDFSLMGLQGRLVMMFDSETGVPVRLLGEAPRIGDSYIDLKKVVLRDADQ